MDKASISSRSSFARPSQGIASTRAQNTAAQNFFQRSRTSNIFVKFGATKTQTFTPESEGVAKHDAPTAHLKIRSRSEDGLSYQMLLASFKLQKYTERIKQECFVDLELTEARIASKQHLFSASTNQTLRYLQAFTALLSKVKQIPAPFFSGRTFWAVVKETDTLKNDLAAFKELYLLRHRNKSLQDFSALESLIEIFIFIVFKPGRLVAYKYAAEGKSMAVALTPRSVVKRAAAPPLPDPSFKSITESQKIRVIREQFEAGGLHEKSSVRSIQTSSSEDSFTDGTPHDSFRSFVRQSQILNEHHGCFSNFLNDEASGKTAIQVAEQEEDPLFAPSYDKSRHMRLEKHLHTVLAKELPPPSLVCRICEGKIPALSEEDHTKFCEQRREIQQVACKRVNNELFKIYTDLSSLVTKSRTSSSKKSQMSVLTRSGSLKESKLQSLDQFKRKSNHQELYRSQSKQYSIETPDTFQSSEGSLQQRPIPSKLWESNNPQARKQKMKNNMTTGKIKKEMMRKFAGGRYKKPQTLYSQKSSQSSLRQIESSPGSRPGPQRARLMQKLMKKQRSMEGSPTVEVKRRNQNMMKIQVHPFQANSDKQEKVGGQSERSLSLERENLTETIEAERREKHIILQHLDLIKPVRTLSGSNKSNGSGTPKSKYEPHWEDGEIVVEGAAAPAKPRDPVCKLKVMRRCTSLEHDESGGQFGQDLRKQLFEEDELEEEKEIMKTMIEHEGYLNLADLTVDRNRRKSHVPNVDAFLEDFNRQQPEYRSNSAKTAKALFKRIEKPNKARNSSGKSENSLLDNIIDHLNATQLSIEESSAPSQLSSRKKLGPSTFLGDEFKSPRNCDEQRDEIFSVNTSDDWGDDSLYKETEVHRVDTEGRGGGDVSKRLSRFAFPADNSITMSVPDTMPPDSSSSPSKQGSSSPEKNMDFQSFKFDTLELKNLPEEAEPEQRPSSRLKKRSNKKSHFVAKKEKSNSNRSMNPSKRLSAAQIDPPKVFKDQQDDIESPRQEQQAPPKPKPFIQSFKPLKRIKKHKEMMERYKKGEKTAKKSKEAVVVQKKKSSKKEQKNISNVQEKLQEEVIAPTDDNKESKDLEKQEDQKYQTASQESGSIIGAHPLVNRSNEGRGSIESRPRYSIRSNNNRRQSNQFRTMSSLGTADSDNSQSHRILISCRSMAGRPSISKLQALAQMTESAKQQVSVPLEKESIIYELQDCMDKVDSFWNILQFNQEEAGVIQKFKASLKQKCELAIKLQSLEQKLTEISEQDYFWKQKCQDNRRGTIASRRMSKRFSFLRSDGMAFESRRLGRRSSLQGLKNNDSLNSPKPYAQDSHRWSRRSSHSDCQTPTNARDTTDCGQASVSRTNTPTTPAGKELFEPPAAHKSRPSKKSLFSCLDNQVEPPSPPTSPQQLTVEEHSSENTSTTFQRDLTIVSEEAKHSSGIIDDKYVKRYDTLDEKNLSKLNESPSLVHTSSCCHFRRNSLNESHDNSSVSSSTPSNYDRNPMINFSPRRFSNFHDLAMQRKQEQAQQAPILPQAHITEEQAPQLVKTPSGPFRNLPQDIVDSDDSEESNSPPAHSDYVFAQKSEGFNLVVSPSSPKEGEEKKKNSSKKCLKDVDNDDDSFTESDISFDSEGGGCRYKIQETLCSPKSEIRSSASPKVAVNNYLTPSNLNQLPGNSFKFSKGSPIDLRRKLTAISEAKSETSCYRGFYHSKTFRFERMNTIQVKQEPDAKSMPELTTPIDQMTEQPLLGELSDGAHSDNMAIFSDYVIDSMEFFGDKLDNQGKLKITRKMLFRGETGDSSSRGSIFSDEGDENSKKFRFGIDFLDRKRRVRKRSSQRLLEKKMKRFRRALSSIPGHRTFERRNTVIGRRGQIEHIEESDEDDSEFSSRASAVDDSYEYGSVPRCHSMEFTPSMLESVRNMDFSSKPAVSISNFDIIKKLSKGAYGFVVLAEKKTSKDLFALKIMIRTECVKKNQIDLLNTEKNILQKVNSDFVVHGAYSFRDENFLYIAMEYLPGGDLAALLINEMRFEWEEARFYLKQVVLALDYMRANKYVHRDLKPDNILLDKKGHLKLTDFGLSKAGLQEKKERLNKETEEVGAGALPPPQSTQFLTVGASFVGSRKRSMAVSMAKSTMKRTQAQDRRILGTPNYMSPEVISGKEHSYAVDYWSLGVMAYEIIVGALPFSGDTVDILFKNIVDGNVEYPDIDEEDWPPAVDDFVRKLLDPNPKTRLGSGSIDEIKNHEFFKGVDWGSNDLKPPYVPQVKNKSDFVNKDPERDVPDDIWNAIIKASKGGKSSPRKKNTSGPRSKLKLSSRLVKAGGKDKGLENWDGENLDFIKKLQKEEAEEKKERYMKNVPTSLMDELNPSSSDGDSEQKKRNEFKRQNSLPQSQFSKGKRASFEERRF